MNISGIILVLIAAFLIYQIHVSGQQQTGGALKQMTVENRHQDPYYARQYRELDDVDNVLNRPQELGKKHIQDLVARNLHMGSEMPLQELQQQRMNFSDTDVPKIATTESAKVLVENQQPYFLDEALILDREGRKYYWDWRYPKQPISVDFVKDPDNYVKTRPNEYPSYVIRSRDYSDLGPNSD
jgi:hypothetical protein